MEKPFESQTSAETEIKIEKNQLQPISTQHKLTIFLFGLLVVVGIIWIFVRIQNKKVNIAQVIPSVSPSISILPSEPTEIPTGNELMKLGTISPIQLGNFVFSPPPGYLYPVNPNNLKPETVYVSKIEANDSCEGINNFYGFGSVRYLPNAKPGFSPFFGISTWNLDEVTFTDELGKQHPEGKIKYLSYLKQLEMLPVYTDQTKLQQEIFKEFPKFDLSSKLNSCGGGGWSYPLLVSKVKQDKFDTVYYVEINSGNGDLEQPPSRYLYIKDGRDWVIASEGMYYQKASGETYDLSECNDEDYDQGTTHPKLECVEKVWREKYRNEAENQTWIDAVLRMIQRK